MVYLIGVNHIVQFDPAPHAAKIVRDKRVSFKAHVLEVIENFDISILAEEFNDEAKKIWLVGETTLEHVATAKGIDHRFCEPGREEIWLSQIEDCKNRNMLFVCGDDHFESFAEKLIAAGFDVKHGSRWRISDEEIWADL
jgi:hypothetical protein